MQGLHLTADLYGCQCDAALLINADELTEICRRAVDSAALTVVADRFFTFPDWEGQPGGVTGAVLLAESHLALHTWPEFGGVTLDVYVCNFSADNSGKAEQLLNELIMTLAPLQTKTNRILRGSKDPETHADELMLEWINPESAYGFRVTRRIEAKRTPFQMLEVFDTPQWGKVLRLDGSYMTSERDEFFYHEPIVHIPAISHPSPRTALVIGGGDGGSSEELLKHPSIERIKMVELDAEVVNIAREHLQKIHHGAFDDPRLTVSIGDGWQYVEQESDNPTGERFDLIILDLTDPDTPAIKLYTQEFFFRIKKMLSPGGAMMLHLGSPVFSPARVQELLAKLRDAFAIVRPLGLYIPLYGAYWGMACASDSLDPLTIAPETIEQRLAERHIEQLNYYNGEVHRAMFALPNFYRTLTC